MGQNGSTPRLPETTMTRPLSPYPRTGSNGDAIVSEDETMVDVSSSSSLSMRRTSTSQRTARMASPGAAARTRGVNDITTRQQTRRSSLWCRVQSLRNRIYRTTRRINLVNNSTAHSSGTTRTSSSHSPNRRSLFGEPSNRYSAMFGNRPNNHTHTQRPRPQSYHAGADPFVDNIDPRFEPSIDRRPQSSYSRHRSSSRTRSIWGVSSPPPHPPPLPPPPQQQQLQQQQSTSPRPLT